MLSNSNYSIGLQPYNV